MGLDDSYTNVRGQILLMQPLPLVSKAYSMLRQEEKQRDAPKASQMPIPTALNTYSNRNHQQTTKSNNTTPTNSQTSNFRKAPYRKGIFCTNCGKEGHYGNECYKLVGYPPGHPLHGKYTPPSQRSQSGQRRSANAVVGSDELEPNDQSNAAASTSNSTNSGDPYVYWKMDQLHNQLNQVLLMMQNQGLHDLTAANLPHMAGKYIFIASFSSGFKQLWIIDSGATDHICTCLTLMTNLQQCKPITVHLPNGHTTTVTTIGSMKIKPNLTLTGVLYIPTFTYNLISVSKLTNSTHSSVTFSHNQCIFQGHDGSKATGSLHGGLYTLTSTPTTTQSTPLTTAFTQLSSHNLWHARLGHPSSPILKKIKSISPLFQCNSEFTCAVCPLSKQHKLPFSISNSHATSPF